MVLRVVGLAVLAAAQPRVMSSRLIPRPGVELVDFSNTDQLIAASPVVNLGATSFQAQEPVSSTWAADWTVAASDFGSATTFPSFGTFDLPVVSSSTGRVVSSRFVPTIRPGVEQPNFDQSYGNVDDLIAASPIVNLGTTFGLSPFGSIGPVVAPVAAAPTVVAPPKACCRAITAECFACSAGLSIADYCKEYSFVPGCVASAPVVEPVVEWDWSDWAAPVSVCPNFMCYMYCEAGFEQDENGCDICSCKTPPPAAVSVCPNFMCMMYCEAGFKQDENGCDICSCKEVKPAFDCRTREVWTDEKVAWCCDSMGVGCPVEPAFNCRTREVWTDEKVAWCCENAGLGCPVVPDVATGCCVSYGFGARMIPCCFKTQEGVTETACPTETRMGGKTSWLAGECPAEEDIAASVSAVDKTEKEPEPKFNCMTKERFTNEKAAWCCSNKNVGCLYAKLSPAEGPAAVKVDDPLSDETCANGLKSADNAVCCPAECGTCGGYNCGLRPGGASNCCGQTIRRSEMLCTKANAPCVLTAEADKENPLDVVEPGSRHTIVG